MRGIVVLVCLVGCTPLFGLDGVHNDDPDGDRIPYPPDNCPTVANPDQSDVDKDGVGDACQLCMATDPTDSDGDGIPDQCDGCDNRLPDNNGNGIPDECEHPHDEDSDGIADIHDNCPAVANADQADTNDAGAIVDGVGNACDDAIGLDRQLFDGFAQANQLWTVSGTGWVLKDDQAVVPVGVGGAVRYAGSARGTFKISTHVTLPSAGVASIIVIDGAAPIKQVKVRCSIAVASGTAAQLSLAQMTGSGAQNTSNGPYTVNGPDELWVEGTTDTSGASVTFSCHAGHAGGPLTTNAATTSPVWTPGLGAASIGGNVTSGDEVGFDYFDVVTSGP